MRFKCCATALASSAAMRAASVTQPSRMTLSTTMAQSQAPRLRASPTTGMRQRMASSVRSRGRIRRRTATASGAMRASRLARSGRASRSTASPPTAPASLRLHSQPKLPHQRVATGLSITVGIGVPNSALACNVPLVGVGRSGRGITLVMFRGERAQPHPSSLTHGSAPTPMQHRSRTPPLTTR